MRQSDDYCAAPEVGFPHLMQGQWPKYLTWRSLAGAHTLIFEHSLAAAQ
jgi:hypothetical protein